MSYILFTPLLVFSLGDLVSSQDANIQLLTNVNYQIDKLKFGCSPIGNWDSISRVSLSKNSSTGFKEFVAVYLDAGGVIQNKTVWYPTTPSWQNRATIIKEYVNPKSGAGLEFDISPSQTLCSDEGTYRCAVTGTLSDGQTETKERVGTVTLTVKANSVNQIIPVPQQSEGIYNPYSVVVLRCTGQVGNPPENLRWCFRRSGQPTYQGWSNNNDIVHDDPISFGCQNTQTSTLRFNVTAEDPYTEFKCETGYQGYTCGHSSIISSNITIYRYTAPAVNNPQTDDTASGGVIAGAVIGSFVGIILIVVLVYFFAFRKKNEGETYRTKEENGRTGSAPIDNTVYSVPEKGGRHGDRDRLPRDRSPKHYENRGLDEPQTRGYNSDPRGRSNPGMDRSFDDVRDGNMKSSRGPMMGSNASFGSAV